MLTTLTRFRAVTITVDGELQVSDRRDHSDT